MVTVRHVGFGEAIKLGFQKYVQFSGRAQRSEFWYFQLFLALVAIGLWAVDVSLFGFDEDSPEPLSDIWLVLTLIPTLSIGWRRLHDIGRSGWWSVLWAAPLLWTAVASITLFASNEDYTLVGILAAIMGLIAMIGALIYVVVLCATDSEPRDNRFGPSVKYGPGPDRF